jgi:pimeloyl-[acyl-carrier protein] methyl ester esterase
MNVFLHGFGTTPEIWDEVWKPRSSFAGFQTPNLSFDNLEREAERVGRGMGYGVRVIGWSMGGMVAQLIAAKYPEKVEQLVLVSTTPKFIASNDFPAGLPPVLLKRLEKRIRQEGLKAFHALVFPDGHSVGLANLTVEQAELELAALEKVDFRAVLGQIKAPTLIIHGDKDEICPLGAAIYMYGAIPGSQLVMLEGVGHAPMIEAPDRFKEALCRTNS